MAAGTSKEVSAPPRSESEKIINFVPGRLRANFMLRCAALAIDYIVLIIFPVGWLLISRLVSETASGISIASISWYTGVILSLLNFFVLPLWCGQTVGKMIAGIMILKKDGTHLDLTSVIRRHLLGYPITLLTLGLGFLIAAVNNSGRALHDVIGGTAVVRARKAPVL